MSEEQWKYDEKSVSYFYGQNAPTTLVPSSAIANRDIVVFRKEPVLIFYCGVSEMNWNHHPVTPGPYACVSPKHDRTWATRETTRVYIPPGTQIIQDSGAFSDGPEHRLTFETALERQITHAKKFGYTNQITHRASYDLLIDEKWQADGYRRKERWSESEAEAAVSETIAAAKFMAERRGSVGAILSAQGVTPQQYARCTENIIPLIEPERDIFGLGGWCIIGLKPKRMLPVFLETISHVIPMIGQAGIRRVHIWGCCYAAALGPLQWLCDQHNIAVSTDSAGPVVHPSFGQWGYDDWRDIHYRRPAILSSCKEQKYSECRGCLGLDKIKHVALTHKWLERLRESRHYHAPEIQQSLWDNSPLTISARRTWSSYNGCARS